MEIPATSVSLLKDLANGTAAVRWTEFCRRYEPVMRAFLDTRFPSVDADDTIQESLVALMKALPEYRYTPDQNGHFRNYLVGIVRHKVACLRFGMSVHAHLAFKDKRLRHGTRRGQAPRDEKDV